MTTSSSAQPDAQSDVNSGVNSDVNSGAQHKSIVQVNGLVKSFKGGAKALQDLNLNVNEGDLFGLVGPDGAGKSTTLKILAGVMEATTGEARLFGKKASEARGLIGYVPQNCALYPELTVDESLAYEAGLHNVPDDVFRELRKKYLEGMGLARFGSRLTSKLSGGMRQNLALCCALISSPKLILLDEPTTGLDPIARRELWQTLISLTDEGVTTIIATPFLDEAERCSRIALMYEGKIHETGSPEELQNKLGLTRLEITLGRSAELADRQQQQLQLQQQQRQPGSGANDTANESVSKSKNDMALADLTEALSGSIGESSNIVDLYPFGDHLEVLAKDSAAALKEVNAAYKGSAELRHHEDTPSLENVFVMRLRELGLTEVTPPPFPQLRGGADSKNASDSKDVPDSKDASDSKDVSDSKDASNIKDANSPASEDISVTRQKSAIKAENLIKKFGDFAAVNDISLDIKYGEIYGLLGANGAGKTTTIKMLCGLLAPTSGKVTLAGESGSLRSRDVRRKIGYMSQKFTLYDGLTVDENLEFYAGIYELARSKRKQQLDWAIAACGLGDMRNEVVGKLPLGWKQRIAFSAAVMHDPEVIFLDEPTAGVDPLARRQLWRTIREFATRGAAILVTTHYLDEAEYCNRLSFVSASRMVVEGTPSEIKAGQTGKLFEVTSADPQKTFNLLADEYEPWRLSIFGRALHILLDDEGDIKRVEEIINKGGVSVKNSRSIPFSLEDAFIAKVQHGVKK